jgi:hypothetical protein
MSITGSNNQFSCSPAINTATNTIIALGTVTRSGNAFTFSVGFVWKINGTIYQNNAPVTITVAPAATGFYRIDNAILNTSNSIELQQGLPSDSIALQPVVPETAVLLTSWNISGPIVSDQTEPIVGATFVKKSFADYFNSNISGIESSIALDVNGRTEIRLTNPDLESIASVDISAWSFVSAPEIFYNGKQYLIRNLTGNPIIILENAYLSGNILGAIPQYYAFSLKEGVDLELPNNEAILFHYTNGYFVEIFRSNTQEKLVSSSNIKTIDGKNLLGAGDLVIDSGNYANVKLVSGGILPNIPIGNTSVNFTASATRLNLMPFTPSYTFTSSNLIFQIATAVAGANCRLIVYSHDSSTGLPKNKIYESFDISAATTGLKTVAASIVFEKGKTYWIGVLCSSSSVFIVCAAISLQFAIGMDDAFIAYTAISKEINSYDTAPLDFGTTHIKNRLNFPRIGIQIQ